LTPPPSGHGRQAVEQVDGLMHPWLSGGTGGAAGTATGHEPQ